MNWSRLSCALFLGVVIVGSGLVGCGGTTSEPAGAGIPSHRGPASANLKKGLARPKPSPRAPRGMR